MRGGSKSRLSTSPDSSKELAIEALTFLAADAARLERFLSVTGLGPDNLRAAAASPGFYGSVIGYLVADEPLLIAFAAAAGQKPEEIARALQAIERPAMLDGP